MLTGSSQLAQRVARVVNAAFPRTTFLIDAGEPRLSLLRKRIARNGLTRAAGQVAFRFVLARIACRERQRLDALWRAAEHPEAPLDEARVHRVETVNSEPAWRIIAASAPDAVVVFSTRRLSRETIAACNAPILNLHPGITPGYRGVHTGYWALRRNDPGNFGTTIHLIDDGLDTGPVVEQIFCRPRGNIALYPTVLTIAGLPALLNAAALALDGALEAQPTGPAEAICLEPTLWSYVAGGLAGGHW